METPEPDSTYSTSMQMSVDGTGDKSITMPVSDNPEVNGEGDPAELLQVCNGTTAADVTREEASILEDLLPNSLEDISNDNNDLNHDSSVNFINKGLKRPRSHSSVHHHHTHETHDHSHSHNNIDHHHHYDSNEEIDDDKLDELEKEAQHFHKIVATFKLYRKLSLDKLRSTFNYIQALPTRHQELLSDYSDHLKSLTSCIEVNQNLFQLFVHEESNLFENHDEFYPTGKKVRSNQQITSVDFDRLQAILKHIVRDWSVVGEKERTSCYSLILSEIQSQFPNERSKIRVLVPGAGLGRLTHEIVRLGYDTQGNEFSLLMLFASNFILNKCYGKNLYKCFPWIHQNTNVVFRHDQLREVTFPDIDPTHLSDDARTRFSMTAGDFLDVYSKPEQKGAWNCVATCFFIDCAHNVVDFLEKIHYCLKDGGVWINLGPLLYHYSDIPTEKSIEPSYDLLMGIARKIGFHVEKEQMDLPTFYTENTLSMLNYSYKSVFFVCRKLPSPPEEIS